jgi:hypothetical protein
MKRIAAILLTLGIARLPGVAQTLGEPQVIVNGRRLTTERKSLGRVSWALTKITVPVAALMALFFFMVSKMHGTALAAYGGVYGGFILFLIGYWTRSDYKWTKQEYERELKWEQEKEQFKRASYNAVRKCGYSARGNC